MKQRITIGTRGSKLALWQTKKVKQALAVVAPELTIEIKIYKTIGDRQPELNLLQSQGKGIFCSEIEQALFRCEIDLAVHSVKDLPGDLPAGLMLGAYLEREDPREVLVGRNGMTLDALPPGAKVGTSSIRRLLQLKRLRPDLVFEPIRGNVETRIRKVQEGQYDATILAWAGVHRLELENNITQIFGVAKIFPAPGQGCIGVERRAADSRLAEMLAGINHRPTELAVRAERAFLRRMGGNCESASGAYSHLANGQITLTGLFGRDEHDLTVRTVSGSPEDAEALGVRLAEELLNLV